MYIYWVKNIKYISYVGPSRKPETIILARLKSQKIMKKHVLQIPPSHVYNGSGMGVQEWRAGVVWDSRLGGE